jgi:integrase
MHPRATPDATENDLLTRVAALSELLLDPVRLDIAREQKRPIGDHLAEYRAVMRTRGGAKHVANATQRLRLMVRLCRVRKWPDLAKSKIEVARAKLMAARPRRRALGPTTVNHYLNSLKGLCNWMVDNARAERSPCRGLKPLHTKGDLRRKRRALSCDEVLRLIAAAADGRTIAGIPGHERAIMYVLATTTGLRSAELQSLTSASFRLDDGAPRVVVEAAHTKNGEPASIPIRADVGVMVRAYLRDVGRDDQLFRRPKNGMYSMLVDLRRAGIRYCVNGEYADFHTLRHTFVSNLFESGATPKEAQTLARHQDPRLTLGRYAHSGPAAQRAAVERLPAPLPRAGK